MQSFLLTFLAALALPGAAMLIGKKWLTTSHRQPPTANRQPPA
jgi:hypothetical protein